MNMSIWHVASNTTIISDANVEENVNYMWRIPETDRLLWIQLFRTPWQASTFPDLRRMLAGAIFSIALVIVDAPSDKKAKYLMFYASLDMKYDSMVCKWLPLTHWGGVTHVCVSKLTIIGSDNGLSPGRRQAIIWSNAGILLIGPLGVNFSEILIEILTFSFKKMLFKVLSAKWRPFCLGLNGLNFLRLSSTVADIYSAVQKKNILTHFRLKIFISHFQIL